MTYYFTIFNRYKWCYLFFSNCSKQKIMIKKILN